MVFKKCELCRHIFITCSNYSAIIRIADLFFAVQILQMYSQHYKYFLKKDKTKLKAFLTSRSTFFSFRSPLMVQPCFMSGNSTISNASPRICLLNPSFLTVSESFSEGKYNCGHLMSFKQVFSSSPRIA